MAIRASYPLVPLTSQSAGSLSSPSMIFSTAMYSFSGRPNSLAALAWRRSKYCLGSYRPSGWSMRRPATPPVLSSSNVNRWAASNTSCRSMASAARLFTSKKRR